MSVENPITNRADALRAYRENKLYFAQGGNLAKCEAFMDACMFLLETPLAASEGNGESVELRPEIIERFLNKAQDWYNANYSRLANCRPRQRLAECDF